MKDESSQAILACDIAADLVNGNWAHS